jgi:hypothetical protein
VALEFARECIPTKTITIRDRDKPWFNSGIKRVMKIRDSLHKKCVNSRILITYANIRFHFLYLKEVAWYNYDQHCPLVFYQETKIIFVKKVVWIKKKLLLCMDNHVINFIPLILVLKE